MSFEQRQTLDGKLFYFNAVTQVSQLNKPSTSQSESMVKLYPTQESEFYRSLSSLDLYTKRHAELEYSHFSHLTPSASVVSSFDKVGKQLDNLKSMLQLGQMRNGY